MAAPITHIVLTDKIFDKYFSDKDPKKFFVGTSFPDIRHLVGIPRGKTHFMSLNLDKVIEEEDPFMCGVKFHSLLDLIWEDFVAKSGTFFQVPEDTFALTVIGLVEDSALYTKVGDWDKIRDFFSGDLNGGLSMGATAEDSAKWYEALKRYFLTAPSVDSLGIVIQDKKHFEKLQKQVKEIWENEVIRNATAELYDNFEEMLLAWEG